MIQESKNIFYCHAKMPQLKKKYNGIIASVSQTCSLIHKELAKLAEMALDLSAEFRQTIGFLTKCLNSF